MAALRVHMLQALGFLVRQTALHLKLIAVIVLTPKTPP
jgi:hypothetical protein